MAAKVKPYSLRLEDDLKRPLQQLAMEHDRSLHYILIKILREAVKSNEQPNHIQKPSHAGSRVSRSK
jgi:predicted transcriptional regulator